MYNDIRNEGLLPQKSRTVQKSNGFLLYFTDASGMHRDSIYMDHPLREYADTRTAQGKLVKELFIKGEAYTEVSITYTTEIKKLMVTDLQTREQQTLDIR
jgi:hypothetical protein